MDDAIGHKPLRSVLSRHELPRMEGTSWIDVMCHLLRASSQSIVFVSCTNNAFNFDTFLNMKQQGKKRKGGTVTPSDKRRKHPNSSEESFDETPSKMSVDVDPQHGQEDDRLPSTNGSDFNPEFGLRHRSNNSSSSEYENKENQKQSKDTESRSGSIASSNPQVEYYHRQDSPHPIAAHHSVLPLSMQMMRPFWKFCEKCAKSQPHSDYDFESTLNTVLPVDASSTAITAAAAGRIYSHFESTPSFIGKDGKVMNLMSERTEKDTEIEDKSIHTTDDVINHSNHLELIPPTPKDHTRSLLQEYIAATHMYGCAQINPGVMTAIRFSLPTLRVSGSFHDSDMLALCEVLFRHCNGALYHIQRLDFSIAGRYGKLHGRKGFGSHGAFTLSRVLCISNHIEEVILRRNKIGPYGASAIFAAASKNSTLKNISLRRCHIGEKGAFAFVEYVKGSNSCGLREVDLSVNGIGFQGSIAIEEMLIEREKDGMPIDIDLDGNLVIQESEYLLKFLNSCLTFVHIVSMIITLLFHYENSHEWCNSWSRDHPMHIGHGTHVQES